MFRPYFIFALMALPISVGNLQAEEVSLCKYGIQNQEAIKFVGNMHPENGIAQLQLLFLEGLTEDDFVCDIGCGALVGSIPIMSYLKFGHFVGVEPNQWLIEQTLKIDENRDLVTSKQPLFINNECFDATASGLKFNYIIAHSIISHAARWQLPLFFENCAKVLEDGGKVIFSVRLTEPNAYGSPGAPEELANESWAYPGVNFFHYSTLYDEASKWFSGVELKKEYTEIITSSDRSAFHDWIVLTK